MTDQNKKRYWRYGYMFRPPMPGAQPREGLIECHECTVLLPGCSRALWGYAVYDRELTQQELYQYELMGIDVDGVVIDD